MPIEMVKLEKENDSNHIECCDGSHYPYGTQISFEDDLIRHLSLEDAEVGQVVELRAFAVIESKSEHKDENRESKNMSLQMTSIGVSKEKGDLATRMYPDDE